MAVQGKFSGTTSNSRIKPTITWTAAQSVEGNWSDITAILTYSRTNTGYITGGKWKGSITIGEQTFSESKTIEITHNSNTEAMRATVRVYHDDYGQKTLNIRAAGAISGSTLTKTTISQEVTLDTIARASAVSAAEGYIGGCATVVITRKNDGFTHSLGYAFGSGSGYVAADGSLCDQPVQFAAGVVNMTLPESFYDQLTDSSQGKCTLTCATYSGETLIGTKTAEFTVRADPKLCAPVITGTVAEQNALAATLTGDSGNFIRYVSDGLCTVSASGRFGATITEKTVAGIPVTGDTLTLEKLEQEKIIFTCTDSRGFTASCEICLPLIPYIPLTNNAAVQRTDPTSGNATLTFQGSCWQGTFGAYDNELRYEYSINGVHMYHEPLPMGEASSYTLTEPLQGLDYQSAHTVEVTVHDKVMSVTKTLRVNKGVPVFDWGENDFAFHVPVSLPELTVDGVALADYIRRIIQGG